MRRAGSGVKIVPRVLLEGWTMADYQEVFASEHSMTQVAEFTVQNLQVLNFSLLSLVVLVTHIIGQKHKFDGMVLEVWSQLGGHFNRYMYTHTLPRSWCLLTVVFQTLVCVFSILHSELAHLVRVLASALHAVGMELILVIPAPKGGSGNTH